MPNVTGVYPVYENQFEVGAAADSAASPKELETFSVSISNGVETWTPMDQEGWQSALMTAKAITISITGKRCVGDTGNDYIVGKAFTNGRDSYGYFAWVFPDGTKVSWDKAVYDVKNAGTGDSTNVGGLEFDVISNGKPKVTVPEA